MDPPPGIPLPKGPGYWSLTHHTDIVEANRKSRIFCSGKGATSIMDMPPMMLEFFGGLRQWGCDPPIPIPLGN